MTNENFTTLKGHCTCRTVTYEVLVPFLAINCCHCTWCQRETGSAFALNAIIESSNFLITSSTAPVFTNAPSASGDGQMLAQCPECHITLYSDYGGDGKWMLFVRAGTLDDEGKRTVKPDLHIYTSTKMAWVDLSAEREKGVPIFEDGDYKISEIWRKESLERFDVLKQKMRRATLEMANKVDDSSKA